MKKEQSSSSKGVRSSGLANSTLSAALSTTLGFSLMLLTFAPSSSLAKWAEVQNAPFVVESETDDFHLQKDGSYRGTFDLVIELLTDEARNIFGLYRMTYDKKTSHLKILSAVTINGSEHVAVNPASIEDKPLASSGPGFDQSNQITIPFPELKVGSKIHLRYTRSERSVIPGYFGLHFAVGRNEYIKSLHFNMQSELPLYAGVNDPDHVLQTTQSRTRFTADLKKPIYRAVTEEENGLDDLSQITWVSVGTLKSWNELPNSISLQHEARINTSLPEAFNKILLEAQKKSTDIEKINVVTSRLQDLVRYVGDWRKVDGGYIPRPLQVIAKTGYGDCKDFSTVTNAILRKMGFETYPAWVRRERFLSESEPLVPVLNFNHAISLIKKDGRTFWIDPTNNASNAQGLFNDIENRQALVLYPTGARLEKIPPVAAGAGTTHIVSDLNIISDDLLKTHDHLEWKDQAALFLTSWGLTYTKPNLDFTLLRWVADTKKVQSWAIGPYDMSSRIVHDLSADIDIEQSWLPTITTRGKGFALPSLSQVNYFNLETSSRVSSLKLEDPYRWIREFHLTGRNVDMRSSLNCEGDSPWIQYSRKFEKNGKVTVLRDQVTLKTSYVPVAELKSETFREMKKKLLGCMGDAVVLLKD